MTTLRTELLHQTTNIVVKREIQDDGTSRIVKLVTPEGGRRLVSRLRYEYSMLQRVAEAGLQGAPRPLGFLEDPRPALILSDLGGTSLRNLIIDQTLPIDQAVEIALAVAEILGRLQQVG